MADQDQEDLKPTPAESSEVPKGADILLVEDNEDLAVMFKTHIKYGPGYSVDYAPDLASALDYLKTKRPTIVVTDMQLTRDGEEGWTVVKTAKRIYPDIPIVLLASQSAALKNDPRAIDVNIFISKPYTSGVLLPEIKAAIESTIKV